MVRLHAFSNKQPNKEGAALGCHIPAVPPGIYAYVPLFLTIDNFLENSVEYRPTMLLNVRFLSP